MQLDLHVLTLFEAQCQFDLDIQVIRLIRLHVDMMGPMTQRKMCLFFSPERFWPALGGRRLGTLQVAGDGLGPLGSASGHRSVREVRACLDPTRAAVL